VAATNAHERRGIETRTAASELYLDASSLRPRGAILD
jgi:hypothetical protein